MRTLFLIGILAALIVIATKKKDQSALEAAVEMGQRVQSIAAGMNVKEQPVAPLPNFSEYKKSTPEEDKSFIGNATNAIESYKPNTKTSLKDPGRLQTVKGATSAGNQKKREEELAKIPEEKPLILPRPQETKFPEIPPLPKAYVKKVELDDAPTLEIANAEPSKVDVGASYDLVKGYYENASRLLEEIK